MIEVVCEILVMILAIVGVLYIFSIILRIMMAESNSKKETEIIRCKDCKWFGQAGCSIDIVDDSDRPNENDFCSFAERKDNDEKRA